MSESQSISFLLNPVRVKRLCADFTFFLFWGVGGLIFATEGIQIVIVGQLVKEPAESQLVLVRRLKIKTCTEESIESLFTARQPPNLSSPYRIKQKH